MYIHTFPPKRNRTNTLVKPICFVRKAWPRKYTKSTLFLNCLHFYHEEVHNQIKAEVWSYSPGNILWIHQITIGIFFQTTGVIVLLYQSNAQKKEIPTPTSHILIQHETSFSAFPNFQHIFLTFKTQSFFK